VLSGRSCYIKLFQCSSIVFDLHNNELSDGLPVSQCYLWCNTEQMAYKLKFLQLS